MTRPIMDDKEKPKHQEADQAGTTADTHLHNLEAGFCCRLFAQANTAIVGFDRKCLVVTWNGASERAFGKTAEEALGRQVSEALPQAISEDVTQACQKAIIAGTRDELHLRLASPEGAPVDLSVQVSPLRDEKDEVWGGVVWAEDVTRLRKLERDLAASERLASLGTLAGGVAHHFNNILGGVSTFVDYALQTDDPRASRRALQMTAQAADRAAKITKSLLAFAQKDSSGEDVADLTELVLTFTSLVERTLASRHIELGLHLHPVPVVPVRVDWMHTVLGNLLDNAEEAMAEGGKIDIRLEEEHGTVVLRFSDDGAGISAEAMSHIFEPFYTTKAGTDGGEPSKAGLGLAVVYGLVAEMGATIDAKSSPGQGTTFSVRFFRPAGTEKNE